MQNFLLLALMKATKARVTVGIKATQNNIRTLCDIIVQSDLKLLI